MVVEADSFLDATTWVLQVCHNGKKHLAMRFSFRFDCNYCITLGASNSPFSDPCVENVSATMYTNPTCYMPCPNSDDRHCGKSFCAHSHCWCNPMRQTAIQNIWDVQSCLSYHGRAKLVFVAFLQCPPTLLGTAVNLSQSEHLGPTCRRRHRSPNESPAD